MKNTKTIINKRCGCGRLHTKIPRMYTIANNNDPFDGIYFDCECKSTMMIPKEKMPAAEYQAIVESLTELVE